MNFISAPTANPSTESMIQSLHHWWSLAGVDLDYDDQPSALLAAEPVVEAKPAPLPLAATEPAPAETKPPVTIEQLPSDHDDFLAWLANDQGLVEAGWSKHRVLPRGALAPEVMVVCALPEKNRNGEVQLFNACLLYTSDAADE